MFSLIEWMSSVPTFMDFGFTSISYFGFLYLLISRRIRSRFASFGFFFGVKGSLIANLEIWSNILALIVVTFLSYSTTFLVYLSVYIGDCLSTINFFFTSYVLSWLLSLIEFLKIAKLATSSVDIILALLCLIFLIIVSVCNVSYFYLIFLLSY